MDAKTIDEVVKALMAPRKEQEAYISNMLGLHGFSPFTKLDSDGILKPKTPEERRREMHVVMGGKK